jgi:hypothetical protein
MPTSGSVNFSVSRDDILNDAFIECGAIGPEDTASTAQTTHAARRLNSMVKAWGAYGPALWARKTGYILPTTGVSSIDLGPTGGHATLSYVQTTLSADAASGASTIVVDSATGIANTYYIGVELDSGDMHWTTVNGVPSGTTVTLTAVLTDDASDGNYVYCYQTKLQRPLRVIDAFVHDQVTSTDQFIDVVTKNEYDLLGDKTATGTPNQVVYDPQLGNGTLYLFPQFENGKKIITIIFQRPFEDFDASIDEPDFPPEWYDALCLNLAVRLMGPYGLPTQDRIELRSRAKDALDLAQQNEPEEGSMYIQPDKR